MKQIPEGATKITFGPLGKDPVPYYIWERRGKWYWHALGNEGEAKTRDEACMWAKAWISGQAPVKER